MDKRALYKISYGLYIVSSVKEGKFNGQIANTVFQVSSEPPKVAVCINKENLTHSFIEKSGVFSVSILEKDVPMQFIGLFGFRSGRDVDKFAKVNYKTGGTGAPVILDHTLAYMEFRVSITADVGTHTLFVGKLENAEIIKEGEPMTYAYYHKVKKGKAPKTAPTYLKE